jgi:2,3-dihydroxy-p-cumate/2,3-dihydroxybenzoate 3,4-dioxygenase
MIRLQDVCYVRLGTADLEQATAFATGILGLELAERTRGAAYFKSNRREHTLCYFEGDPADHTAGFEVGSSADLEQAAAELDRLGHAVHRGTPAECEARKARAFVRFQDPTGNRIELVWRPAWSGDEFSPSRNAGITGFSHIGLCSSDLKRDEEFWTQVCNARVSDRIGDAPLLRIDEVHHTIALFPSTGPGIQHINHQVRSVDDVVRSSRFLREQQVRIAFGPGRHATSLAQFLYFEGHDRMVFEYSSGVRSVTDELLYREAQYPFDPTGFCIWGARPNISEFQD